VAPASEKLQIYFFVLSRAFSLRKCKHQGSYMRFTLFQAYILLMNQPGRFFLTFIFHLKEEKQEKHVEFS
jgi:hypothetical protein